MSGSFLGKSAVVRNVNNVRVLEVDKKSFKKFSEFFKFTEFAGIEGLILSSEQCFNLMKSLEFELKLNVVLRKCHLTDGQGVEVGPGNVLAKLCPCLYVRIAYVTRNETPNEQTNKRFNGKSNEQPNEQTNEQLNVHLNNRSRPSRGLTKPSSSCTNVSLLLQCGDVEANPGPAPAGLVGAGVANDGDEHSSRSDVNDDSSTTVEGSRSVRGQKVEKCDIQVMTFNIRGLSDPKKVRHIINHCYKSTKKAKDNFFLFQETFVLRLEILRFLWRGEFHLTPGTGNSQGCLTLVTAPYKIVNACDLGNRAHVVVLTKNSLDKADCILVNAYAPNGFDDAKLEFFEELCERVSEKMAMYNCNNVIVGGDLNVVFSDCEVKDRLISSAERRIAASAKNMFNNLNLADGWENSQRQFTWTSSRTGTPVFSALDRILYSKDWLNLLTKTTDWALSLSDHAAVIATFECKELKARKHSQLSRLDPRLLQDVEGCRHLEARYQELAGQAQPEWNPHVRLEYLKMCIRTAANEANGKLKAKLRDSEKVLNNDINEVISELSHDGLGVERKELLMHKLDDLRQLKRNLVEKIGTKLEQKTARKWYNEGELSNKYFFNLLNRKANDEITVVFDENLEEITQPELIETRIKQFYKDLYESVPLNLVENDLLFRHVPQVDPIEAATMSEDLTLEELSVTLQTCSDSAPGPDGIPYSYLKKFWPSFGQTLLDSWKYSLRVGELPPSHKISYLRLIPKAGKDTRVITNLRPITLSNTDHKLVTKTYARKLTDVVASSIGEEQAAYIPGRLINDNVRSMIMTVDLANVDINVDGVVVSLDAKKAFDSVDHRYIRRCLKAFGLENFINIFNVLYKDLSSKILFNGGVVDGYSILKGVKQGDALSCIIFIMCMEPLIRNIKSNAQIESIASNCLRIAIPKVYSFADDVTVIAKREGRGVQAIFDEYESFSEASGLYLNADKTEILCFNDRRAEHNFDVSYKGTNHVLRSRDRIKVNGIILLQDQQVREDVNVENSIEGMKRLLLAWSSRRLTILGRILIIKTFAMSKMIYLMQTL